MSLPNAFAEDRPAVFVDHAALGRRMGLGLNSKARRVGLALLVLFFVGSIVAMNVTRSVLGIFFFVQAMIFFAVWMSFQATAVALRAQRVFDSVAAPTTALRDWRRGWAQGIAASGALLAAVVVGVAFWRSHGQGVREFAALPGAVVLLQAIAAWAALAVRGPWSRGSARGTIAGLLLLAALVVWFAVTHAMPVVVLATLLALPGVIGLTAAGAQLGPGAARTGRRGPGDRGTWAGEAMPRPTRAGPGRIARFLLRRAPPSTTPGRPWWAMWAVLLGGLVPVTSMRTAWGVDSPVGHATAVLWTTAAVAAILAGQGVHWRVALRPGGPRRDRIGRHLVFSMLKLYAWTGVPLLVLALAVAIPMGVAPQRLAAQASQVVAELVFSIALAVLAVGAWVKRADDRALLWVTLVPMAVAGAVTLVGVLGHMRRHAEGLGHAGIALDGVLLPLAVVCVLLADRAWARRDLGVTARRR